MTKIGDEYVLPDDADDLLAQTREFVEFHKRLGEVWLKCRGSTVVKTGIAQHYEMLPGELVDMLDEIGGIVRCEEEDCRKLCHKDWDFCEVHGIPPELRGKVTLAEYEKMLAEGFKIVVPDDGEE